MNTVNKSSKPYSELLQKTLDCSRYAKWSLENDSSLSNWLQDNFDSPCTLQEMQEILQKTGADLGDETGLSKAVRILRKRVMLKLIMRDLNGLADLYEVMQTMTTLAETCLQQAVICLSRDLKVQFGSPIGESSQSEQELLVIGMGKLGGRELNVSSDIDLIFVYPEDGDTDGERTLSNHEFFTRLGRRLINIISEATADGYVFRVDMRLRPYGESGPLVMSFAALEEYLVSQGREWERYAWIKARVVAPESSSNESELTQLARPFIYRKYLDFGAIDSMRKLHAQIRQEVQRRDLQDNIKLGPGGIREIEFTAQVFQLIRGGQDGKLRIRPTLKVLRQLGVSNLMDRTAIEGLISAYEFLRKLEHRLQYLDDQQTQELPEKSEDRTIIAEAMDYPDFETLRSKLELHRSLVSRHFEQIFGTEQPVSGHMQLWSEGTTVEELDASLIKLGYKISMDSAQRLMQLRSSIRYRQLPEASRQRLDKLIPQFIILSGKQTDPDATLARVLTLLETISRRAVYLAFLAEFPQAMERLTALIAASSWASDYLTRHPALLDELLDAREIYQPPDWEMIDSDLLHRLEDCIGDTERQMDVLRHVQHEQVFHLLAMDLQGLLPLEKLSDHLSDLADLILSHVLKICWVTSRKRHREDARFAIIAYGKLGGRELGYASDLDLIFLYDDDHPDAQENYSRLAQRVNTMLSSYTASGRLYEIDLRLRPNGASGLLVSSVAAFSEYQQHQAWVWEHQALTRARFSAGDAEVGAAFENIRQKVLCQPRDLAKLSSEILSMRQKMHDGHPNNSELFDIKHDKGGMVDIEFMVQFMVLAHAHQHPQLARNIGNLALLKTLSDLGIIDSEASRKVADLYRSLRQIQHSMRLNSDSPCRIAPGDIDTSPSLQLWKILFEDGHHT